MKATGERWERRRWREERPERVAAVDRWGRRSAANEDAGHRNRNCPANKKHDKENKEYEGNRYCKKSRRPRSYRHSQGNPPHPPHPWGRPFTYNIDIFRLVSSWCQRFFRIVSREYNQYIKAAADLMVDGCFNCWTNWNLSKIMARFTYLRRIFGGYIFYLWTSSITLPSASYLNSWYDPSAIELDSKIWFPSESYSWVYTEPSVSV